MWVTMYTTRESSSAWNPCANPGGIQSISPLSSPSSADTYWPNVGDPLLTSMATSSILPLGTRTSFPCSLGGSW